MCAVHPATVLDAVHMRHVQFRSNALYCVCYTMTMPDTASVRIVNCLLSEKSIRLRNKIAEHVDRTKLRGVRSSFAMCTTEAMLLIILIIRTGTEYVECAVCTTPTKSSLYRVGQHTLQYVSACTCYGRKLATKQGG